MTKSSIVTIEPIALPTNWPVGPVNVYLIFGEKITLVDTGLKKEETWRELNDSLNKLGLTIQDIEQVVITHHHSDHAGMLEWILQKNPVPVYAHENAKPYLERDRHYLNWSDAFFKQLFYEFGVSHKLIEHIPRKGRNRKKVQSIDLQTVSNGEQIPYLEGWTAIETKGHSQDHISLVNEESQAFICGDHIIKGMPAGIFMDAPIDGSDRAKPLLQYMESLHACLTLNITKTFSGHGPVIHNLPEVIREQLGRIENRAKRMKQVIADHRLTGFDIIQAMYPKRYKDSLGLFVSETLGMLDLLVKRAEVVVDKKDGIAMYRKVD